MCTHVALFCVALTSQLPFLLSDTRSPATAGIANRPLLFLEHRIPMPELFTVHRFTRVLHGDRQIRLPLLGGDAPRLG